MAKMLREKVWLLNYQKLLAEDVCKVREVSSSEAETWLIESLIFNMEKFAAKSGGVNAYRNRFKCKGTKESQLWHYAGRTSVICGVSSFASGGVFGLYNYYSKLEECKQRREDHEQQMLKIEQLMSDFHIFRDDFMRYREEARRKENKKWRFW